MRHADLYRSQIDLVLLVAGIILAVVLPILLVDEVVISSSNGFALMLVVFEVIGLACCTTGLRGFLDCFQSLDERRHALILTTLWLSLLPVLALAVLTTDIRFENKAAARASENDEGHSTKPGEQPDSKRTRTFEDALDTCRLAMACVGAMLGFYLATLRPPPDASKTFWLSALAAAAAYLAAYIILALLLVVALVFIVWQFVRLQLPDLMMQLQDRRNAANRSLGNANNGRIADLHQQIEWTKGSSAPEAYQKEEVARLQQQIRNLGGSQ